MKYKEDNKAFKCEWLNDVKYIDENQWASILGKKHIKGIDFFKSIQQSNIPNIKFHYLIISDQSKIIVIVPCFNFKLDLIDLLDKSILSKVFLKIRCRFHKFLKIRTFVIGSYASSCEYFIGVGDIPESYETEVFSLIKKQLMLKTRKLKAKLTLIKEIRETQINRVKATLGEDFCFCKFFPNTFVPTFVECRPYPSALKTSHQRRYRKQREKYNQSYTWQIIRDITPYKDIFEKMYLNVLRKAKNKFEVLNGNFFVNLNKNIPDHTFFIISQDKHGSIKNMALIIEEEDRLIPLYLGMTDRDIDSKVLYINMLFNVIEVSEQMNKELVEFGQTSYYPKIMSGAFVEQIYYGFSSYNKWILKLLKGITLLDLFKIDLLSHVYKKNIGDEIILKIEKEYGFKICNL